MQIRIPGAGLIWLSVFLFACSSSVIRVLADLGQQNPIDGRNPISFCNVLCAGNISALVAVLIVFRRQVAPRRFHELPRSAWITVALLALGTGVIAPWLLFEAIQETMVTNVILVSQVEPPLMLLLFCLLHGERVSVLSWVGAVVCVSGVVLSVILSRGGGFMVGKGEIYAALAATVFAVSTVFARPRLENLPLGILMTVRYVLGTIIFFALAISTRGAVHFIDMTSPLLWKWTALYGVVIVFGGQLAWYTGMRTSRALDITLATAAAPLIGIVAAALILSEQPVLGHYVGGAVLLIGISLGIFGSIGKREASHDQLAPLRMTETSLTAEGKAGFKGV